MWGQIPLDFVIVDDELLLQHLDRIQPVRLLLLGQHDLSEVTLSEHSEEVEIIKADFASLSGDTLWQL